MSRIYLIIAGILAVLSATYFVSKIPEHYREQGREEIRLDVAQKSREALLIRNAENERDKLAQDKINREVKAEYELKLQNQAFEMDKRIADIKRSGGLRIAAPTCRESTRETEATSAAGINETRDYRLPSDIEEGLFGLARQCEQVQTKLTALQSWVRLQGFSETKE